MVRLLMISVCLLLTLAPGVQVRAQKVAPQDKKVTVFGQEIHYVEAGQPGPHSTIVLLHGLGGDTKHWAQTLPYVGRDFHILAVDMLGFGQSAKPDLDYRINTLVASLHGFLKQTGNARVTLVGNSLGGWVAASFALAYPQMVERLVLVNSAGLSAKYVREVVEKENLAEFRSKLGWLRDSAGLLAANTTLLSNAILQRLTVNKLKKGFTLNHYVRLTGRGDELLDGRLGEIRQPTLIVWGVDDSVFPVVMADVFSRKIPVTEKVYLEQCGHVPQIQCFAQFNNALITFMRLPLARWQPKFSPAAAPTPVAPIQHNATTQGESAVRKGSGMK